MSTFQIPASLSKVKSETSMTGPSEAANAISKELDDSLPGTSYAEGHALNLTSYATSLRTNDVQRNYPMDNQFTNSQTNKKWRLENSDNHDLYLHDSNKYKNFRGSNRSPVKDSRRLENSDNHDLSLQDSNNLKQQIDQVRKKLIETGQMERLKDFADRRIKERGWRLDAMKKCREIVKQNGPSTTFDMLFETVKETGNFTFALNCAVPQNRKK